MMQSSLGVLVVIAMVREGFHFLGMLGWYKTRESWKEIFLPCCMTDLPRVKKKKMVTAWDSARMYGVTNVRSYQVTKDRHMTVTKVCKRGSASVLNRNM